MFKSLLKDFVDEMSLALTPGRYRIVLNGERGRFRLMTFKGRRRIPVERAAHKSRVLSGLLDILPYEAGVLEVPMEALIEVRKALADVAEKSRICVEISPGVARIRRVDPPEGFAIDYVWSTEKGWLEPRYSHGAIYAGRGWFCSEEHCWHLADVTPQDDAYLAKESIEGRGIGRLLVQKIPEWRKRGLPVTTSLKHYPAPVLSVAIKEVADDSAVLKIEWKALPDAIQGIPSLPGYVVVDNALVPGLSQKAVPPGFPLESGSFRLTGQRIPQFMTAAWPAVQRFAKDETGQFLTRHAVFGDKYELVLTISSRVVDGVGETSAVPTVAVGQHRFTAEMLSKGMDAQARFIRVPSGWLSVQKLRQEAHVGPMGRMTDGAPLKAIPLSTAEILRRGSPRLAGPWARVEAPGLRFPDAPNPAGVAARHLELLLGKGMPGGLVGDFTRNLSALREVIGNLLESSERSSILVVGGKEALDALGPEWGPHAPIRLDGSRRDPDFKRDATRLVLAAPKALEVHVQLTRRNWTLVCLLEADQLIKSRSSKLFMNLTSCEKALTIGLFSGQEFLGRRAWTEALSEVFGIQTGDPEFVWKYVLRNPSSSAPELPRPHQITPPTVPRAEDIVMADLVIDEDHEPRGVMIPSRPEEEILSVDGAPGIRITFEVSTGYGTGDTTTFLRDAQAWAARTEGQVPHVPFMCYWPTYDSMTHEQRRWYFYWRSQVRAGRFPDTDLSYVFVHVYELINNVGVRDAQDGYEQLRRLWMAYRDRHSKLDHYLVDWLSDYVLVNHVPIGPLTVYAQAAAIGAQSYSPDLLLLPYLSESLERLPITVIDQLTDYRICRSKFYREGNAAVVDEYVPKTLDRVDGFMKERSGAGIFDLFRPREMQTIRRCPFQSAVYAGRQTEVAFGPVVPYSQHPPLRQFLNAVVKHTENKLRELSDFRGRLRGYTIEPEIENIIDVFITGVGKTPAPPAKKQRVVIDLDKISALRAESDELKEMLLQGAGTVEDRRPDLEDKVDERIPHILRPAGTPDGLLTDLDPVNAILMQLGDDEMCLLGALEERGWTTTDDALNVALDGIFVEPLIDRVNGLSLDLLGDILISSENGSRIVADDYRDELDYLLKIRDAGSGVAIACIAGLPDEWQAFLRSLAEHQLRVLAALVTESDPSEEITRIATENATMPQMLIDLINEQAVNTVGDVIIEPGSMPPVIEEEDVAMVRMIVGTVQ